MDTSVTARHEAKQFIRELLERNSMALSLLGDSLFYFGEMGMQEFRSAELMTGLLEEHGYEIERGISDFPTGFLARYGSGRPVIALHTEFDANAFNSQVSGVAEQMEIVERREVRRCTAALQATAGVRPVGWTSPGRTGSANTYEILASEGYLWSGDDASDDLPFVVRSASGPLVVLPRTNIPHNDLIMWVAAKQPPAVIWDGFRDTFDELYAEGVDGVPKWTEITLHAHMAGRPTLVPTLRRCFACAKQHERVWFAPRRAIAQWALQLDREGVNTAG